MSIVLSKKTAGILSVWRRIGLICIAGLLFFHQTAVMEWVDHIRHRGLRMPGSEQILQASSALLPIEKIEIPDGLTAFLVERHQVPMVHISFRWKAGQWQEPAALPGLACMTVAVLENGPAALTTQAWLRSLEEKGVVFHASCQPDYAEFSLQLPSDPSVIESVFGALAEYWKSPAFRAEDLERARIQMSRVLSLQEQNVEWVTSQALKKVVYGQTPYGRVLEGNQQSIAAIQLEDVRNFYQTFYTPATCTVAVVGDLSAESLAHWLSLWGQSFSGPQSSEKRFTIAKKVELSKQNNESLHAAEELALVGGVHRIHFPSTQTHLLAGVKTLARDNPDFMLLDIAQRIFGNNMMQDRLFKKIRAEGGLAYHPGSFIHAREQSGVFGMHADTENSRAMMAVELMQKELQQYYAQGPTEEEWLAFKQAAVGKMVLDIASNAGALGILADIGFYQLPVDTLDQYKALLDRVGPEQIRDVFQKWIPLSALEWVIVGPLEES